MTAPKPTKRRGLGNTSRVAAPNRKPEASYLSRAASASM